MSPIRKQLALQADRATSLERQLDVCVREKSELQAAAAANAQASADMDARIVELQASNRNLTEELGRIKADIWEVDDWMPASESRTSWHDCRSLLPIDCPTQRDFYFSIEVQPQQPGSWRAGFIVFNPTVGRHMPNLIVHILHDESTPLLNGFWRVPLVETGVNVGHPEGIEAIRPDQYTLHFGRIGDSVFVGANHIVWVLGSEELGIAPDEMGAL